MQGQTWVAGGGILIQTRCTHELYLDRASRQVFILCGLPARDRTQPDEWGVPGQGSKYAEIRGSLAPRPAAAPHCTKRIRALISLSAGGADRDTCLGNDGQRGVCRWGQAGRGGHTLDSSSTSS